ncbi:MAG: type I-B CRISPR-associated protein Cas8b1/Cst1 [Kiritimatiellae bacterium]|jgi:predicted RNA-binding protein (virulence factor B family)|nr:type I-B CRISPR-associated protein Cas8b1/Cst1 [Kiritimatiellia bacterium]
MRNDDEHLDDEYLDDDYLKETVEPGVFTQWQEVELEVYDFTDLGMNVIINDEYIGLVYQDQIYENYQPFQKLKGYIKLVREDGKIDVSLQPAKGAHVGSTRDKILEHLKLHGGKSSFNDKSSPTDIKREFKVSKKVFKQAIGKLYKQHKILITDKGIELIDNTSNGK